MSFEHISINHLEFTGVIVSVFSGEAIPLHLTGAVSMEGININVLKKTINSDSVNLGKIRIESGILDNLAFQFALTEEKATGKIVGEYRHLIIDKLKEVKNNSRKIAWLKSFALKTFIIPKNKGTTVPEAKRTGKIDYQRVRLITSG